MCGDNVNKIFMKYALKEARKAYKIDEVPVGVVIIKNNEIIAKAHNTKTSTNLIYNHAELIAIKKAMKIIGDWRLNDCEMYVTLEPCPMCASAIQQSRIKKVYIGTKSNSKNNNQIVKKIFNNNDINPIVKYEILNDLECSKILSDFFLKKRKKIDN